MQQRILTSITIALLVVFAVRSGRADTLSEPPQCGADDVGQVYISLMHDVFRLPYPMIDEIRIIPLELGGNLIPAPPNPLVPSGCFANPVRAKYVRLKFKLNDLLPSSPLPDAAIPIVGLGIMPPEVSLQKVHEEVFDMLCATKDRPVIIDTTPEGLQRCAVKTGRLPPNDLEATYKASLDLYATPFGEPFIIRTGRGPLLYGGDSQIDYKIDDEVALYYQFWLKDLPIQNVLDFDRALRAKIEAARVKDYIWP